MVSIFIERLTSDIVYQHLDIPRGRIAFQLLAHLKPAHPRHHDVEQDQIRMMRRHFLQRIDAVDGRHDPHRQ